MSITRCQWDLDEDPAGNVQHIADHGLTKEDAEHALEHGIPAEPSRSSGLPLVFGPAIDGRVIAVIFEIVDDETVCPITAYEPTEERA